MKKVLEVKEVEHALKELTMPDQFDKAVPLTRYASYAEFAEVFPMLATRIQTLFCESCKPGEFTSILFQGSTRHGEGRIHARLQYGLCHYNITLRNGVLYAFGRIQSLRKPTKMKLSAGKVSDYGEAADMLLP